MYISDIYWDGNDTVILNMLQSLGVVENIEIELQTLNGAKFYSLISIIEIDYYGEECYLMNISPIDKQIERELLLKEEKRLITDSIKYASTIQEKLLPNEYLLDYFFKEHFLIWQPRDIVGGDIYFFESISVDEILIFVIDGTGHGVPGAFLTVMIKTIERRVLNDISIGKIEASEPFKMLQIFDEEIREILNQKGHHNDSNDGFDGSIIYYNRAKGVLHFAGAFADMRYIQDGEVQVIRGDRISVGYKSRRKNREFTQHTLKIDRPTNIYLTTDGYIDQIGGDSGVPFGGRRFNRLISENYLKSFKEQESIFLDKLLGYQKENDRQDDITILGLRL
jgi:hypothetical protein